MSIPTIEVFKSKTAQTYLVRIGDDTYEMDDNHMPNGMNQYAGLWVDNRQILFDEEYKRQEKISIGLTVNIISRIMQGI